MTVRYCFGNDIFIDLVFRRLKPASGFIVTAGAKRVK